MNQSCLRTLFGLFIAFSISLPIRADNIVFNTVPDTVTTNGSQSRLGGPGCGFVFMDPNKDCVILLTAPEPGTGPVSQVFLFAAYSQPGNPTTVADSVQVSAGSLPFPPFISFYDIHFFAAVNTVTPCNTVAVACIGPANGSIQNVFTVDWVDNLGDVVSSDTISINSGVPTPEPSTMPWLITASIALALCIRRAAVARDFRSCTLRNS